MQAGLAAFKAALDASMPPAAVADAVFAAMRKDQFYILSHPEWLEAIQLRTDKLLQLENPANPLPVVMKLMTPK